MSQRLTLPLDDLRVTAAYKTPAYLQYWGFQHYGYDCTSPTNQVLACGNGEVVAAGQDGASQTGPTSRLGNVLVIVYRDVACNDGKTRNLTCRMYHLAKILVAVGDKVERGQQVAVYGNTGANTTGAHLHIEFDSDIKFPTLAFGVSVGGNVINTRSEYAKAGGLVDSTIDPDKVWYIGPSQKMAAASSSWTDDSDIEAPALPQDGPDYKALWEDEKAKREAAEAQLDGLLKDIRALIEKWGGA